MEHLHPGVKWEFRINGWISFGIICSFLIFCFTIILFKITDKVTISIVIASWLVFAFVAAEILARLRYKYWMYEFTPDHLKIERGIIWKKYSNIPYERVQNVDIKRGIIARMLGYSSVFIQTAGYSGFGGDGWEWENRHGEVINNTEGYLPAISQESAEKIREFLMKKISRKI